MNIMMNTIDSTPFGEYERKPVTNLDLNDNNLVFQVIDIEEVGEVNFDDSSSYEAASTDECEIRLFGVTQDGNSVCVVVRDFRPYFYVESPPEFNEEDLISLKSSLNSNIEPHQKCQEYVTSLELVEKKSIYGFNGFDNSQFIKIYANSPSCTQRIKRRISLGVEYGTKKFFSTHQTYESNIPLNLRFMIDKDIQGVSWIELPASSCSIISNNSTSAQIEALVSSKDLIVHSNIDKWSQIAPLRILSFDIECRSTKGAFPKADKDAIIQIGNVLSIYGSNEEYKKIIFSYRECASIVDADVRSYSNEEQMLYEWKMLIEKFDPDLITGYNINGFDFPYILDRAAALKLGLFPYLSRVKNLKTRATPMKFSSKAYGVRDSKQVNLKGRLILDVMESVQRDYKLRSYTLNSVSINLLNEQKEDVHHSIITKLHDGDQDTRKRLAIYCLKDAYLPLKIMNTLMILVNYIEITRVTGIPFGYILSRGQQIRVLSQLYRVANKEGYLIPVIQNENTSSAQYEGAVVIDPIRGYYEEAVATLDFSSLYPSIMMAHNLCYTTWIRDTSIVKKYNFVEGRDYIITPENAIFLKPSLRKGVLPSILASLLESRKEIKQKLKSTQDPLMNAILNGRQLALKLSANSVYGFTGTVPGRLPLLPLSSSVTSFGRDMIKMCKSIIEEKYTRKNGYENDCKVIYGDTDSVMIGFGTKCIEEAIRLGKQAAQYATGFFMKPINLEFEKVYCPYLLVNKKRYAGLYWVNPDSYEKLETKGIETVRRDSCGLVSQVVNKCLDMILIDRDVKGAVEYVKTVVSDVLMNQIDISQLVISKSLGRTEYAAKQAHNELAIKLRERDAGSSPSIGDRVAYVIVKGSKGDVASMRAEDPICVLEKGLSIDASYYLDNQLSKPLKRIFEPIIGDKVCDLFEGDHALRRCTKSPSSVGLMKYAVKLETCLGCRTPLKTEGKICCDSCRPNLRNIYQNHINALTIAQVRYSKLWSQCQECQGSYFQEILCTASDCPIFYMRVRARKEMENLHEINERFVTISQVGNNSKL